MKTATIKYKWICTCNAGECDFDTKKEAVEERNGKFCGRWLDLKKRKEKHETN